MKFSNVVLAANATINLNEQSRILKFIKTHPSKEGTLAKKACNRSIIITLLIIFLVLFPFCIYSLKSITINNLKYPEGATKEVRGHISRYDDTFWYTDSSQKYEFSFVDYNIDNSYEPGEIINIYLDDNKNVISISHQEDDVEGGVVVLLSLIIPIALLLTHAFVGRKTYCKWWNLYAQWYRKEIEPFYNKENFEELVANKTYYDVAVNLKDLSIENQKLYRKYRNKNIINYLALLLCIILTIFACIKFELNPYSWIVIGIIIIYVGVFYILITICDEKMQEIKSKYIKK